MLYKRFNINKIIDVNFIKIKLKENTIPLFYTSLTCTYHTYVQLHMAFNSQLSNNMAKFIKRSREYLYTNSQKYTSARLQQHMKIIKSLDYRGISGELLCERITLRVVGRIKVTFLNTLFINVQQICPNKSWGYKEVSLTLVLHLKL